MTTDDVPDGTPGVPHQVHDVRGADESLVVEPDGEDSAGESVRLARRQVELLEQIRELLVGGATAPAGAPSRGGLPATGPGGRLNPTASSPAVGSTSGASGGTPAGPHAGDVRAALAAGQPVPLRLAFAPADYLELHRWAGDEGTTPAELVRRALANERFLEQQLAAGYTLYLHKRNTRRRVLLNGGRS